MAANSGSSSASSAQQPRAKDSESLVAALSSLMPLLMRIQAQTGGAEAGQFGAPLAPNPALDHLAAVSLVEDISADRLGKLSAYLEKNAQRYPALDACSEIVTQATWCLTNRDYGQTFAFIWQAYRLITTLRAIHPDLPALSSLAERMQATDASKH